MLHRLTLTLALLLAGTGRAAGAADEPRSLLGVNTDRLVNYSPACPTIDAIKTSQRFGSARNPGDGRVALDENGWPTDDFGVVVHADVPGVEGVYKLSCEGRARVSGIWGRTLVRNVTFDGKLTTADVEYKGGGAFALTFSGTSGGVRNLKLLRPGYTSDRYIASGSPLFSPMGNAGVGVVGEQITSQRANAASKSCLMSRRTFRACV